MIITAPTGLYTPILPRSANDPGNYTFTISDQPPPRSRETFVQLPLPEIAKKLPDRVYTKQQKRKFLGRLVYDIIVPSPSVSNSGVSQFDIGDILEFGGGDSESSDSFSLSKELLRQDLKEIDFEVAGLTSNEYNQLVSASEIRIEQITGLIAEVSSDINTNNGLIRSNQANINNLNSLLDNIILVLGENSTQASKVKNKLDSLIEEKSELLNERSNLQNYLSDLRDELQKVREVVR